MLFFILYKLLGDNLDFFFLRKFSIWIIIYLFSINNKILLNIINYFIVIFLCFFVVFFVIYFMKVS